MPIKILSYTLPLPPFQWERVKITLPKFPELPKLTHKPSMMPNTALLAITGIAAFIASTIFIYKKFLNFDEYNNLDLKLTENDIINGTSLNPCATTIRQEKVASILQSLARAFLARKEFHELEEEKKFNTEIAGFSNIADINSSQINGYIPQTTYLISPIEIEEIRFQIYLDILSKKHPTITPLIPESGSFQQKFNAVLTAVRKKPTEYQAFCKDLITGMHIYTLAEQLMTVVAKHRFVVTNSLTRNLESQFPPIDRVAGNFGWLEQGRSSVRRGGAHTNLYFNPIAEGNLPFVLDEQFYQNEANAFQATCLRIPCPVDQGPKVVDIAPEYKQFVMTLKEPLGYFSLQFDSGEKSNRNGGERPRIEPFRILETNYSEVFYFFSLAMDGRVFKCKEEFERIKTIKAYKTVLIDAMVKDELGFYFPQQLDKIELKKDLEDLFDQVANLFFPGKKEFNSEKEKQIFLILFYAFIELFYTIKLKLRYKHFSCKDAVDRAGILNIVAMRLQQLMLGKENDHYFSRQLQVFTHLPAFTSRHTAILKHRREHLIAVLDFLDQISQNQKNNLRHFVINGYRLINLSIQQDDNLILFPPHQVITLPEYIKALLLDPKTHNPFIHHSFEKVNLQYDENQMKQDFIGCSFYNNGIKIEKIEKLQTLLKSEELAFCTQTAITKASEYLSFWYRNVDLDISVREQKDVPPKFELTLTEEKKVMRITKTFYLCHSPDTNPEGINIARTVLFIDVDFTQQTYDAQFKTELQVDPQDYLQ